MIRNEFGVSAGGPVYLPKLYNGKNRTFWFFAYEGYRNMAAVTQGFTLPTAAMRNGDFSGLVAMARKTWGGNRTNNGARTQQILASVLRTCGQQGKDAFHQLVKLLRSARPILLEIVPDGASP